MKQAFQIGILMVGVPALAAAIVAGCANAPLRTEASTSGIRAAEEVGAAKVPRAALHLRLAKDELERAKALAAKGEKEKASSMLLRAEADAALAVALSHADTEKSEARVAMERVRQFRQENK